MKKIVVFFALVCIVLATCSIAMAEKYIVNTQNDPLRVRDSADGGYVIGHVAKGSTVDVISYGKWWSKIKFKGSVGYVYSPYLKKAKGSGSGHSGHGGIHYEKPPKAKGTEWHVKKSLTGYLNVRSGPSTDTHSIGKLYAGDPVYVVSTNGGWSKIYYDGHYAYVKHQYLRK